MKYGLVKYILILLILFSNSEMKANSWILSDTISDYYQFYKYKKFRVLNSDQCIIFGANQGYGFNTIKHTCDKGETWDKIELDSIIQSNDLFLQNVTNLNIGTEMIVMTFKNGAALISNDTAKSWSKTLTPINGQQLHSFNNQGNQGMLFNYADIESLYSDIYTTKLPSDSVTLIEKPYKYKHSLLYNLKFFSDSLVYFTSKYPCQYKELIKIDKGEWKSYDIPKGYNQIFYLNEQIIFVYGIYKDYVYIERSDDGGETWTRVFSYFSKHDMSLRGIKMVSSDVGFYWLSSTEVFMTKDGGYTWLPFDVPECSITRGIKDIQVIGNEGWLLREDAIYYNPDMGIE